MNHLEKLLSGTTNPEARTKRRKKHHLLKPHVKDVLIALGAATIQYGSPSLKEIASLTQRNLPDDWVWMVLKGLEEQGYITKGARGEARSIKLTTQGKAWLWRQSRAEE